MRYRKLAPETPMRSIFSIPCIALLGLTLPACLDLKPAPAPVVRWIQVAIEPGPADTDREPPRSPELQSVVVTARESITSLLARRSSPYELMYDDYARWVEAPADVLRQAIDEELYQVRGFIRSPAGGRAVQVELLSFEASSTPRDEARVAFRVQVTVRGDASGEERIDRRIEARTPLGGDDPALVAEGLSAALKSAVEELSDLLAR